MLGALASEAPADAHVLHGPPQPRLDRRPRLGQLLREAHDPGGVPVGHGERLRAARPSQRLERAALNLIAVVVGDERHTLVLVVARDDDVVHRVVHAHAQVVELLDVGVDHRRAPGIELVAQPGPALVRVVGAAHLQLDSQVLAEVALESRGAAHRVQRRLDPGQLEVVEPEPAAEPERKPLARRRAVVREPVELEQVAQRAGAAVARGAVREVDANGVGHGGEARRAGRPAAPAAPAPPRRAPPSGRRRWRSASPPRRSRPAAGGPAA